MSCFLKRCVFTLGLCAFAITITACSRYDDVADLSTADEPVLTLSHALILDTLQDGQDDIVYTTEQSETLTVDAGNILGRLEQEVTFYATSQLGLAWAGITQTSILIDAYIGVINITLPVPHVIRIEPDNERTYFAEQAAGILRRAEIKITEEEERKLRAEAVNNMRRTLEAEHLDLAKAHIGKIITDKISNLLVCTENTGSFAIHIIWN